MAAALGLLVILGVTAYNMYQENKYRRKVREQFGHSDKERAARRAARFGARRARRRGLGKLAEQRRPTGQTAGGGARGRRVENTAEEHAAARAADLFAGAERPSENRKPRRSSPSACW